MVTAQKRQQRQNASLILDRHDSTQHTRTENKYGLDWILSDCAALSLSLSLSLSLLLLLFLVLSNKNRGGSSALVAKAHVLSFQTTVSHGKRPTTGFMIIPSGNQEVSATIRELWFINHSRGGRDTIFFPSPNSSLTKSPSHFPSGRSWPDHGKRGFSGFGIRQMS